MNALDDGIGPTTTTADLRVALADALGRYFGGNQRIARLTRRPSAYRTSFPLEELDVELDDGATVPILLKNLSRRALSEDVRRAKPEFLYDPRREIETYRTVLATAGLGTAACYGAVVDPAADRYWLFLEQVPGRELYQIGELAVWVEAARWLAGLHTRMAADAQRLAQVVPLLICDPPFYRQWLERARAFAGRAGGARPGLDWLAGRYDGVVERLAALPATVIHGEFYASNVLVQQTRAGLRVCPVDWEMAALGPGLIDLAALTAGKWAGPAKAAMAAAYRAELVAAGSEPGAEESFQTALDCCRLHLAVQWLGWAPDWSPPAEHSQDWLVEALRLAEQLAL